MLTLRPPPPVRVVRKYEVEQSGRVWCKRTGSILTGTPNTAGYLVINGELLHHIVALAWVPGRSSTRRHVEHVDADRLHNAASNLRWVSTPPAPRAASKQSTTLDRWLVPQHS